MLTSRLKTINLTGGRTLMAGVRANPGLKHWVVLLPESGADFMEASQFELARLVGTDLSSKLNFLIVNKTGLSPIGRSSEFERSFRRDLRVQDALDAIEQTIPSTDKIYLIGYSEGAYIAPEVALLEKRVGAMALLAGGTRSWLEEELSLTPAAQKHHVLKAIEKIRRDPNNTKKCWRGFSYATWSSYDNRRTLDCLSQLTIPVLAVVGARDHLVDTVCALDDLWSLEDNGDLEVEVLAKCGHFVDSNRSAVRELLKAFWFRFTEREFEVQLHKPAPIGLIPAPVSITETLTHVE